MNAPITAIVENGLLRPTTPLGLADGTRVTLTVAVTPSAAPKPPSRRVKDLVAEIAAMPLEDGPEFSGRDHDRILYGEGGAR